MYFPFGENFITLIGAQFGILSRIIGDCIGVDFWAAKLIDKAATVTSSICKLRMVFLNIVY